MKKDEKTYLTPNQKKRIAFINHQFHSTADTVNCYTVFAHPQPHQDKESESRAKNVPPPPAVMDPYEAARITVEKGNNTVFMERVVRVDRVSARAKGVSAGAVDGHGEAGGAMGDADPKYTIFVGNLDFASREEDVRAFFENLVIKEKGIYITVNVGEGNGLDLLLVVIIVDGFRRCISSGDVPYDSRSYEKRY